MTDLLGHAGNLRRKADSDRARQRSSGNRVAFCASGSVSVTRGSDQSGATAITSMLRQENMLFVSWFSAIVFMVFEHELMSDLSSPAWLGFIFIWLFGVILFSAMSVVRHADCLAIKFGEPYGTLILTMSVISIEIMMIASLMLHGENNPTFARDAMFGVIMIMLNGMIGIALLLGALRFREQQYNLQGAGAYLVVIIPLAALGMALPNFTTSTQEPTFSTYQATFLLVTTFGLYGTFLLVQTTRHRRYFEDTEPDESFKCKTESTRILRSTPAHLLLLLTYLLPVVLLSERLSRPIDYGIEELGAPSALGGFMVAVLILAPEAMGGIRAAMDNHLQRSVNIILGSVLSTIGLTIPAVLAIGLLTGNSVVLGLPSSEVTLLFVTILVSMTTFSGNRTNILHGAVHILLFLVYIMLIFRP
jgi:Ca2+:H+ antiporter